MQEEVKKYEAEMLKKIQYSYRNDLKQYTDDLLEDKLGVPYALEKKGLIDVESCCNCLVLTDKGERYLDSIA